MQITGTTSFDDSWRNQQLAAATAATIDEIAMIIYEDKWNIFSDMIDNSLKYRTLKDDALAFLVGEVLESGRKTKTILNLFNKRNHEFRAFIWTMCERQFKFGDSKWYRLFERYLEKTTAQTEFKTPFYSITEPDEPTRKEEVVKFRENLDQLLLTHCHWWEAQLYAIYRFNWFKKQPWGTNGKFPTYDQIHEKTTIPRSTICATVKRVEEIIVKNYPLMFGQEPPNIWDY